MKDINITKEIRQLHLEKKVDRVAKEVKEEMKHGAPQSLKEELSTLLDKCKKSEATIISFPTPVNRFLAETELLAAAPKNISGNLASQPLVCLSQGFSVDIRRVLGSEDAVTLYFEPVGDENNRMERVFSPYKGQTISLDFILNGVQLLTASVYVDESARQAEGEGVLISSDVDMNDSKIEISVRVEE